MCGIEAHACVNQTVHDLQHLSFVLTGVLIWNLLIDPARTRRLTVPGRILLAGATGVIGRQTVPVLAAAGHQVIERLPERHPARVDGANEWQVFRGIIFPLLLPDRKSVV